MPSERHTPRVLKTLCSWCGVTMRDGPPAPISHGCCRACGDTLLTEERRQAGLDAIRLAALKGRA